MKGPLIFLSCLKRIRISDAKYISCPLLISILLLGDYILFVFHLPYAATVIKSNPLSNINKIGPTLFPQTRPRRPGQVDPHSLHLAPNINPSDVLGAHQSLVKRFIET